MIQTSLLGDTWPLSRSASQWMTPDDLATRVVSWAAVQPGDRVLEPSAGDGALVRQLVHAGADVTAVETDRGLVEGSLMYLRCAVRNFDFLLLPDLGQFNLVIMNPPYEDGQDLRHVLHALTCAPRVVALLRLVFLAGQERGAGLWSRYSLRRLAVLSTRPRFRGDGDNGAKSDFAVFDIWRTSPSGLDGVELEWW
jgi:hypothetical protein